MGLQEQAMGIAVVGYGYWGPNIARNLIDRPEFDLLGLCELDTQRAAEFSRRYPGIPTYTDLDVVLLDPQIEAVAIATPPRTHHALVRRALEAGKHVLVEKPLATTSAQADDLIGLAEAQGLVLMPGHTFLYSPPVNKVRDLIRAGELGDEIYFVTSSRMNLGVYQADGVVCDLAPHDLSILLYWLERPVSQVAATACTVFQDDVPETAFLTVTFEGGPTANIQISWLAPRKVRQMVVVGSERMVQYEDTASDDTVRLYDRGLEFSRPANFGEYKLTYRSGDMIAPRVDAAEPLSLELEDFARTIRTGAEPRSTPALGREIVRALEAAQESMSNGGTPVAVAAPVLVGHGSNGHANGANGHINRANGHVNGANGHVNGSGNGAGKNGYRPGFTQR
jgi:predicted dehydrogenase